MSSITDQPGNSNARRLSLRVLGAYMLAALASALVRLANGSGEWAVIAAYVTLLGATGFALTGSRAARLAGDWLPLIALPILYGAIPGTIVWGDGRVYDPVVQGWDRALFGTDPARTLAGALPNVMVSEVLHAAYLSYYAIIYGPPLLLYLARGRAGFHQTVLAFTLSMVGCFVVFCVFPVEGPRYGWPAPAGVPDGPFRSAVLMVLEGGSSRGTAFPSSHLAIALSISLSSLRWMRGVGTVVLALSALLALGAVYGGFHYAADMLAGAVWGVGAWWLAGRGGDARSDESRARLNPFGTSG